MTNIKRFHVRDGYVLDEHPDGSVVRYDKHVEVFNKLEHQLRVSKDKRKIEREAADDWQQDYDRAMTDLATMEQERDNYIDGLRHSLKENDRLRAAIDREWEAVEKYYDLEHDLDKYGDDAIDSPALLAIVNIRRAALEGGKDE